MLRKILPIITLALGFILVLTSMYLVLKNRASQNDPSAVPAQVNFPAPELTLTDIQGVARSLADYRGQVVLVNLWATWCPPCREEMPAIEKMYTEYKDEGFVVLAIDMTYQDDVTAVQPFVEKYGLSFPVLLDETGTVGKAYQLKSLPSSYFINRDGIINEVVIGGPMSEALLRIRIEDILK